MKKLPLPRLTNDLGGATSLAKGLFFLPKSKENGAKRNAVCLMVGIREVPERAGPSYWLNAA